MSKFAGAPMVAIVDYTVGNVLSVANALDVLGVPHEIVSEPEALERASHVILPGVGSFGAGMEGLRERGLVDPLREFARSGKPFLGICLGMQLLADFGLEHGRHEGLGMIPGRVEMMPVQQYSLRLPHIGWNDASMVPGKRLASGLGGDGKADPMFYFVHSYHFIPEDESVVAGRCEYGFPVVAFVERDNIFGAQCHPEKSAGDGVQLLRNFINAEEELC